MPTYEYRRGLGAGSAGLGTGACDSAGSDVGAAGVGAPGIAPTLGAASRSAAYSSSGAASSAHQRACSAAQPAPPHGIAAKTLRPAVVVVAATAVAVASRHVVKAARTMSLPQVVMHVQQHGVHTTQRTLLPASTPMSRACEGQDAASPRPRGRKHGALMDGGGRTNVERRGTAASSAPSRALSVHRSRGTQ